MKKLILLFGAVAILLAACSDGADGFGGVNGSDGVRDKIESAKDGATISLRDYDDEKSTYTVTAKNLTLENANMPNTTIVVSDKIGDADFTLKNCVFKALEVRGGGSNSVHIEGSTIVNVIAKKKDVRIVLERGASVTDLNVEADCTLDADGDENNAVVSISISKTVTEFKIGAAKETSSESIKITITNIKFDTTSGAGESNVKIVVKNPEIVKGTEISDDIKDKVFDDEDKPVIKNDDSDGNGNGDGTGDGDDTGDTDDTVDEEGYKKLPLQLQEKFIVFSVDSDSWSDGVTVESVENGEVFLIKNTNTHRENVFDVGARINMPYDGKKGKSYSVKFDLKADTDCYVSIRAEDGFSGYSHPSVWCTLSTEWKPFELRTGILYEDWSEYTTLTICMGDASEVAIKNLKIKEDEKLCIPTCSYYTRTTLIDSIEVTSSEDRVKFVSSISPNKNDSNDPGVVAGIDIQFGVLEAGKLYKVTFDVTPDATGNFVEFWGHARRDEYDTEGNANLLFEKGVKKTITLYIPCYALPYTIIGKDGSKIGSGNLEKSIGFIWVSCFDGKEHTITVENIEFSIVERGSIESIKANNKLGFYIEGNVTGDGVNYEWTNYKDLDNHDCFNDIILMPGYEISFDYIMSDDNYWDSTETTITAFRYGADKSIGNKVDHNGYNKLYYKNENAYPVALHFGLDDEWRVTVEAENATGQ